MRGHDPRGSARMFTIEVKVGLKKGVVDPEGSNTLKSLNLLGFEEVGSVKTLKVFRIEMEAPSKEDALKRADEMCQRLLMNPVIHTYLIDVI
ncbi:MAG: phosphoribosylformylglycinamidine synthase subunit PurS [Candidatus Thermoplasmatota archaeon]|nr:phosphoribosylformylglycinamidine synthase subunit PurS [Candidatus Thermoplasmatota archaeon]